MLDFQNNNKITSKNRLRQQEGQQKQGRQQQQGPLGTLTPLFQYRKMP
jgi:hypothetical protein